MLNAKWSRKGERLEEPQGKSAPSESDILPVLSGTCLSLDCFIMRGDEHHLIPKCSCPGMSQVLVSCPGKKVP